MSDREEAEKMARDFVPGPPIERVDNLVDLILEARAQESESTRHCEDCCFVSQVCDWKAHRAAELRSQKKGTK